MTVATTDWSAYLTPPAGATRAKQPTPWNGDEAGVTQITEHFNAEGFELSAQDGGSGVGKEGLSEREMMFLSRETFIRFLIATKGDVPAAIARLENTIIWRRTEKIDDVEAMAADCGPESTTGKNLVLGYTAESRPIVYFFPARNTTPPERRRAVHAVFMLERATDLMVDGVTSVMVAFSFAGKRQGPPTSIPVARETLRILSEYYPEKLHVSHFLHVPWVVKTFITLMWPFVDPNTKKKVKFEEDLGSNKDGQVGPGSLLKEVGGSMEVTYDHEQYWPTLLKTCLERRADQLERWRALGPAQCGRSELDFKVSPNSAGTSAAPVPVSDDLGVD